jgi:hypothetical protein
MGYIVDPAPNCGKYLNSAWRACNAIRLPFAAATDAGPFVNLHDRDELAAPCERL